MPNLETGFKTIKVSIAYVQNTETLHDESSDNSQEIRSNIK